MIEKIGRTGRLVLSKILGFIKWVKHITTITRAQSEYWLTFIVGIGVFAGFQIVGAIFNWHTYPNGIFQKIPFAVVAVAIFGLVSLFLLHAMFPNMRKFLDKDNPESFQKLTLWQKYSVSLFVFALLLLSMVLLANSL